mgnify:CR=1 FL=1
MKQIVSIILKKRIDLYFLFKLLRSVFYLNKENIKLIKQQFRRQFL